VDPFLDLVRALQAGEVRFVIIGVWAANCYAAGAEQIFATEDRDLLLPLDAANLLKAWDVCAGGGLQLWLGDEPLGQPRDRWLADQIVERRGVTRATDATGLQVDLTLIMAGFDFTPVEAERRVFLVQGVELPVARLAHIVASKAAAGRDKDRLFLATHAEALRRLLSQED
jgi:hypothetical protein